MFSLDRRTLLRSLSAAGVAAALPHGASAQQGRVLTRPVPSSGEALPLVGLGSWVTFNVGNDPVARDACAQVMGAFFAAGGRMIDSSPMYGSSQQVIGYGLTKLGRPAALFSADKVWISSGSRGPAQIEASRQAWGVPRFDLLQVHNLLSWEPHLRSRRCVVRIRRAATIAVESLPIRLSPTATSGSVRPCSWTFTSVAIFGSHNRSQSSSDFFPTTRPAPPTWRRLAGATGLFAPIVSRGVSANHPSRLTKPENVAERHPSRGQSPAPASLPRPIHLPFQQAVLSVQRLPFPARHRGRRHRTLPTQSFTPEPAASYM